MRRIFLSIITLLIICTLAGCKVSVYRKDMNYMDTYIEVKLYDIDKSKSEKLFKEIEKIYKEYHQLSDRYNEYENIINVYYLNNKLKLNEEVEIDSKLSDLINYGLNAYDNTDGYINIAMGNVIDIWNEYRESGKEVPKIYNLMEENVSIKYVKLNGNKYKKTMDISLDLGSFVKGYVTELVGKYLESEGCSKYLINAGGNVKVGKSYKSGKYNVGIEEPFNTINIYKTIKVENVSVVTSGSYQRYYEVNDKIYSHIINPKTLFPDNYTKSVTVITDDSAYADIMSTYLFMLPVEDGLKLVNSLDNIEAIWYADEVYYSESFNIYE